MLYKPRLAETEDPVFVLAPLLMVELGDDAEPAMAAPVTVCAADSGLHIGDGLYPRVTYTWQYPRDDSLRPPNARRPSSASAPSVTYSLAVTLGPDGFPLVYEVTGPSSGRRAGVSHILFVSESLEARAAERFGPPPPGRRFSVEPPLEQAPAVVVAGVVADGPVVMGPYVYVDRAGDVTTLSCRCAAAQVDDVPLAPYYDLVVADSEQCRRDETAHASAGQREDVFADPVAVLRWPLE
ncbi:MAG: hypothetical protein ACE5EX_01970, partial [Phycisphaerae bacterium]